MNFATASMSGSLSWRKAAIKSSKVHCSFAFQSGNWAATRSAMAQTQESGSSCWLALLSLMWPEDVNVKTVASGTYDQQ